MTFIRGINGDSTARRLILALIILSALPLIVWAGCKSDCRAEYDSEVESCKLLHDDPDDADDLKTCIQNARDEFDSCIEECDD